MMNWALPKNLDIFKDIFQKEKKRKWKKELWKW